MTTPTPRPTPEAQRHRASARRWALAGEWGFTAASSAVNVTVIAGIGGSLLRILLGGLAPVVLAAMSRLLAKLLQTELVVSGVHRAVALAVAAAVTAIGLGAFALSFETLRRAAEPDHGDMAWIFPATLDLAIVVCAGVLAVIARADEADQRAGVPPRVTVWSRVASRFSATRTTSPVAWLVAQDVRHDAGQEPDHGARQEGGPQQVSSDDAVTLHGDAQVGDAVTEPLTLPADAAVDRATDPNHGAPDATVLPSSDAPARRLASVPAASTGDTDEALILRLIAEGASGADVAAELGVSKSTALRRMREMRKSAELVDATA